MDSLTIVIATIETEATTTVVLESTWIEWRTGLRDVGGLWVDISDNTPCTDANHIDQGERRQMSETSRTIMFGNPNSLPYFL